ncbi:MAG: hypothetical protein J1F67_00615 [Muribaculaceae bacterium]|nr:hypothetical protein [Muribaculaceae bacterium]
MKKLFITLTLIAGLTVPTFANLNGNGFYRVKNYGSSRWGVLVDNKADVDMFAGTADLHSLELTNDTEEVLSDPGSIVYVTELSSNKYDVASQGVSLESLVNATVSIRVNGTGEDNENLYMIYGTSKGATKYIGDANIITTQKYGKASINVTNPNFNKWYVYPVDASSDNYFGAVPTVTAGGNYYTTLFTSFAYKPYSTGVKAYYIARTGYGMAEMIEITGAVPPGSPVIIQCASENVSDNRMEVLAQQDVLPSNSLTGVYFNYFASSAYENRVKYNPETMRILGVCSDGSLGFIKGNIDYIPANTAYLKVPANSAPELKCVTPEEYEANLPLAPESFNIDDTYFLYPQGENIYSGTFEIPANEDYSDILIRFNATGMDPERFIGASDENSNGNVNLETNGNATLPFAYDSPYYWVLPNWQGGTVQVVINLLEKSVTFSTDMAGVDSIIADGNDLTFNGKAVICESANKITLYNSAGQIVASANGHILDVTGIQKGVYVATANGKSIKIVL